MMEYEYAAVLRDEIIRLRTGGRQKIMTRRTELLPGVFLTAVQDQAVQDRLLQPQLFKAALRGRGGYERASAERASARQ